MTAPTYKRVCQVIGTLAGIDPEKIAPAQALGPTPTPNFYWHNAVKGALSPQPIDLDSLDRVTLAMKLEDEFSITITDEEVDDRALDHVGGLVAFVQGKVDARRDRLAQSVALYNQICDRIASTARFGPSLPIIEQPDGSAIATRPGAEL